MHQLTNFWIVYRITQAGRYFYEKGTKGGTGPKLYTFAGATKVSKSNNAILDNYPRWGYVPVLPSERWVVAPAVLSIGAPIVFPDSPSSEV